MCGINQLMILPVSRHHIARCIILPTFAVARAQLQLSSSPQAQFMPQKPQHMS